MSSVGSENVKIFKYLGLDIIQNKKYDISLSQTKFIAEIKKIEITGDRSKQKHLDLNEEELKSFRHLLVSCYGHQTKLIQIYPLT